MRCNVVYHLRMLTGYSFQQISDELAARQAPHIDASVLELACDDLLPVPEAVASILTKWIIELWQEERAGCQAKELWFVDRKYSGALGRLTVSEFMRLTAQSAGR